VVWHGHTQDLARLVESADANCSCGRGAGPNGISRRCSTHQILADQHMLDHLAFTRSVLNRLIEEEWRVSALADSRVSPAQWSTFVRRCTGPREPMSSRAHRQVWSPRTVARGLWLISLVALVVMLGVHAAGG
jgi:hypothetical protein